MTPDIAPPKNDGLIFDVSRTTGTSFRDTPHDIEDDLGELDPSKACSIDNPECESCS